MTQYNGWTNYETWNFANYYMETITDKSEEISDNLGEDYDSDEHENQLIAYVEGIIELIIDEIPECANSLTKDLAFNAFRAIDVSAIVHAAME